MVLINNLTIDEINAALIALQRTRSELVEKQVQTQSQEGTDVSKDIAQLQADVNGLKDSVATKNQTDEFQSVQIRDIQRALNEFTNVGIESLSFDEEQRVLTIQTMAGEDFFCNIPAESITLSFVKS